MKQVLCWCKPIPTFSYMAGLAIAQVYQTLFKFLQNFYLPNLQGTVLFLIDYHLLGGVRLQLINCV